MIFELKSTKGLEKLIKRAIKVGIKDFDIRIGLNRIRFKVLKFKKE